MREKRGEASWTPLGRRDPVLLADVMERADVRMVQAGGRLGFPLEPLAQIGIVGDVRQEHLDGDGTIQAGVERLVDLPHASSAELGLDLVGAERGARGEGHLD